MLVNLIKFLLLMFCVREYMVSTTILQLMASLCLFYYQLKELCECNSAEIRIKNPNDVLPLKFK